MTADVRETTNLHNDAAGAADRAELERPLLDESILRRDSRPRASCQA